MVRVTETESTATGVVGLAGTILRTSGPMALLAIALVVFLAWGVWGRLDRLDVAEAKVLSEIATANVRMQAFSATQEQQERERSILLKSQVQLLRQLCVNSAKSDAQRLACSVEQR